MVEFAIGEHVVHAAQQMAFIVGFEDEAVGAARQPEDHILGIGHGGDQDDRNVAKAGILLDPARQFVAVHFRHDHVADDQRGQKLQCHFECHAAVVCHGHLVPMLFEHAAQPLGLGRAVFRDQDFRGRPERLRCRSHGFSSPCSICPYVHMSICPFTGLTPDDVPREPIACGVAQIIATKTPMNPTSSETTMTTLGIWRFWFVFVNG